MDFNEQLTKIFNCSDDSILKFNNSSFNYTKVLEEEMTIEVQRILLMKWFSLMQKNDYPQEVRFAIAYSMCKLMNILKGKEQS
jgi:hypothetical protein